MSTISSNFRAKTAIITGSSSGIGAKTAQRFAELGANVVITGRNETGLAATKDACLAAGSNENSILIVAGDLTKSEHRARLVDDVVTRFGGIDILVNNAAVNPKLDFVNSTEEDIMKSYHAIFQCNVETVVELTKKCLPHLLKSKGNIVNISSVAATKEGGGNYLYGMSKAALDRFTTGLAHDLGSKGIRVNSVSPGPIDTPLLSKAIAFYSQGLKVDQSLARNMMAQVTVLGQIGDSADIANAVVYLTSNDAKFITGANLVVDGGTLVK